MKWVGLVLAGYVSLVGCNESKLPVRSYSVYVQFEPARYTANNQEPQVCTLDISRVPDTKFKGIGDVECDNTTDLARTESNSFQRNQLDVSERVMLDGLLREGQRQFLEKYAIHRKREF